MGSETTRQETGPGKTGGFPPPAGGVAPEHPPMSDANGTPGQPPPLEKMGRHAHRRRLIDRTAAILVQFGGLGIIASILGILLFIVFTVLPLLKAAEVTQDHVYDIPAHANGALLGDEYNTHVAMMGPDGVIRVINIETGAEETTHSIPLEPLLPEMPPPKIVSSATIPGTQIFAAATSDGRIAIQPVDWDVSFEGSTRVITPGFPETIELLMDGEGRPFGVYTAHHSKRYGITTAVAQLADGTISIVRRVTEKNSFTGEVEESIDEYAAESPYHLTVLMLDEEQRDLYGGTSEGQIVYWRLAEGQPGEPEVVSAGPSAVTALSMLIGGRSLVAGQANGNVSIWFRVRPEQDSNEFRLTRIRDFPSHPGPIAMLAPSKRDRAFLVIDQTGLISLNFSTSERTLWQGRSVLDAPTGMYFSPKSDYAYVAEPGKLAGYRIKNPHPEVSWKALFGKIWYEGYTKPDYTWQSTGGTDDFESKISLLPLLVGTLKGTFYSLILAIPLAVFGAMFASQFMHPTIKGYVKPMVETMASLPSVVLGFLAGLWLAPLLQKIFPGFIAMFIVLPLVAVAASRVWMALPRAIRNRYPAGVEVAIMAVLLVSTIWACVEMSPAIEKLVFGGNFERWLDRTLGIRYDQRNAVVVGLAMGFAVIPIIFAISEDALSNVPRHLTSASLALGASRWQTVTQVVLPTASPGIFSAIMIGFGRAVGETMIVLMATGNTPIMDWDMFAGFRTLSANIAVEIPEAPIGGTLYRTLFVAALLLFMLTFTVNTLAELIRQRLRERYAKL